VDEVRRKFFGTLYNTYSFFALYANVDGFRFQEEEIPVCNRPELDRWIISLLNSLIREVDESLSAYEPTRAGRAISEFVTENLSNGSFVSAGKDIGAANMHRTRFRPIRRYIPAGNNCQTDGADCTVLFRSVVYRSEWNYGKEPDRSVHLADFPEVSDELIDKDLEQRMSIAQRASSMILDYAGKKR
jgi:isoleucyl-tRNA synthetase